MDIQTSADPAVLWLRARRLCCLGGHAPQSGEIIDHLESKDDMPADLADSLKADEEDRKTYHAPIIQVNDSRSQLCQCVVLLCDFSRSAVRWVSIRSEDGRLRFLSSARFMVCVVGFSVVNRQLDDVACNGFRGTPEERGRGIQEHILAEKVISAVDEEVFVAERQHGRMCGCGWLAKAQATTRVDVSTAPRQRCCFLFWTV